MTGVRKPKDEEEEALARIAIEEGKGLAMEEFIENVLGDRVEPQFVDAVVNRLQFALEGEEEINIVSLIKEMRAIEYRYI
jgi:hypothetical protein